MSDPVLALLLTASFFAALTAASWFRTLDAALWREARVPLIAGAIAGGALHFVPRAIAIGVVLTLAALYVRLMGRESEPTDGMILGAMTGGAAAIPLTILQADRALLHLSSCILAGAIAGYGITFGLTHVRDKLRQLAIDAVTAAVAVGMAALPAMLVQARVSPRHVAIAAVAFVPLLVIATVFKQWPAVRDELRHEAVLGVIDDADVHAAAHPFRRLGRAGWHDAGAHREFVRLANKIALRKRQQRGRSAEIARLYQLEVIKLRMELQNMTRIDRAMRSGRDEFQP